jgi:hypothetical protein
MPALSPRREVLASFEHAYAVAVQRRCASGIPQFVIRTGDELQPFRVTSRRPDPDADLRTMVA